MVELSTAQITGIISIALILSGAVVIDNLEKTYYCPTEDNVKECFRLSSTNITCYYFYAADLTKGDRCTNGKWQPVSNHLQELVEGSVKVRANDKDWNCQTDNGFITSYSKCKSDLYEGYIGEFI